MKAAASAERNEANQWLHHLQKRVANVLPKLFDVRFQEKYITTNGSLPSVYILTTRSSNKIFLDILTRCPGNQSEFIGTHRFVSNLEFEKQLAVLCRTPSKPGEVLTRCRNWDVAVKLFMKVEIIEGEGVNHNMLKNSLKREASLLRKLWEEYQGSHYRLEDMTGIPIIFEYRDSRRPDFRFLPGTDTYEIDIYGMRQPMEVGRDKKHSGLSFMAMEKLGPSVSYLLDLQQKATGKRAFSFSTAFKVFDQLVCRLLQLHRLKILHGRVEPRHLNFGRHSCINVLYLHNYAAATVIKHSVQKNRPFMGTLRYASLEAVMGYHKHPWQDLESAFYTLLAMLSPSLPWDKDFQPREQPHQLHNAQGLADCDHSALNGDDKDDIIDSEDPEHLDIVKDYKSQLWHGNMIQIMIPKLEQYHRDRAKESGSELKLASQILIGIHELLGNRLNEKRSDDSAIVHCLDLSKDTSSEFKFYFELRSWALMFFSVSQTSRLFDTLECKSRLKKIKATEQSIWDLSNWCFIHYDVAQKEEPRE